MTSVLPDVLDFDLKVVFCGTAAGAESARQGAYYAGPGNRFWPMLDVIGLTPHQLQPSQFREVQQYGIGLTDIVKQTSGADRDLRTGDFDPDNLRDKIARYQPRFLAFNGKRAAQAFLQQRSIAYGRQPSKIDATILYVLPSTSGAARAFWNESPWFELASQLKSHT